MSIKTSRKNSGRWDVLAKGRADQASGTERSITRSSPDTPNTFITPLFETEAPARPFPSPETDSTHLAFLNTGLVDISGDATWRYCGNAGLPGHRAYFSCREGKKMRNDMQTTGEI
jgi:hypothetical protein